MSDTESQLAIETLLHKYCFALDEGRAEDFADLFTDDGTFHAGSTGRAETPAELRGIVETIDDRWEFVAHLATNPVIDVDDKMATGKWYYLLSFKPAEEPLHMSIGTYQGEFSRVDGEWKISDLAVERFITQACSG